MPAVTLRELTGAFSTNRMVAAKAMRGMQDADPQAFLAEALEILRETALLDPKENPGGMYLLAALLTLPDVLEYFCDPERFSPVESLALIHQAKTLDPQVEIKLCNLAVQLLPYETDRQGMLGTRILQVMGAVSDQVLCLPALRQVLNCRNPRIRSQAALLLGRIIRNPQWARGFDPREDPRVAANAIESLWGLDSASAKEAFREASQNVWNRLAGNGALGLDLAGDFAGVGELFRLSRSEDPKFRATAAWCMGRTGDLRFLPRLRKLAQDPERGVHAAALRSLTAVSRRFRNFKNAPALALLIRSAQCQGAQCNILLRVGDGGPQTHGFTAFDFVVSDGGEVVEQYSLEESHKEPEAMYEITYQARSSEEPRLLQVDLHSERGCGSCTASVGEAGEEPASGIRLESCPDSGSSSVPSPPPLAIRLPSRRRPFLGRSWHV